MKVSSRSSVGYLMALLISVIKIVYYITHLIRRYKCVTRLTCSFPHIYIGESLHVNPLVYNVM